MNERLHNILRYQMSFDDGGLPGLGVMKPLRTSKNIASNNYFVLIGQFWSISMKIV